MTWFLFLYRSLLALMPPAFRARHGADALRMAAARVREEAGVHRGARAIRELADLLLAIPAVRREFARAASGPDERTPSLGGLLFETRQALRAIRRSRLTTGVAVLVLGVSIGMSTAVFSIADRVLFRPLPYPAADRLVEFLFTSPTITGLSLSGAEFAAAREASGVFEQVEGYRLGATALRLDGPEPERLNVAYVTPGFLPLLGGRVIGSGFSAGDAAGDAAPVALLAYDYWRSRMGADERAIGALIQFDGEPPLRIVGVVDESFAFPTTRRSALPDVLRPLSDSRLRESGRYARGIGRLRNGVPPSAVADAVPVDPPLRGRDGLAITATPIGEVLAYGARNGLFMLLAGVVALLAVGVLDVSGLLVVQAAGREREIVTRRALGAGTGRIARQLLLEGLAIALLSGALGLLVARFGFAALARMVPPQLQVLHAADVDLDARALVFAAAVALISACLFGLAPLLHLGRVGLSTLRAGAGQTRSGSLRRIQGALVAGQIAGAMALAVVGALLMASFVRVIHAPLGFDADRLAYISISLPRAMTATRAEFYDEAIRRVAAIPGVESTALIDIPALRGSVRGTTLSPEGREVPPSDRPFSDTQLEVTAGYFQTAGLRILEGRGFTEADTPDAASLAVVNQKLANAWFPGESAVGQRLASPGGSRLTIIGVVQDARHFLLKEAPLEEVFLLMNPARGGAPSFVVRADDPATVTPGVVAALRTLAPGIAVTDVETGAGAVSRAAQAERFYAVLLSIVTATGLALAALGLYGMLSWSVGSRRRELALRAALGAEPRALALTIVRQAAPLVAAGALAGALLGWWSTRLVRTLLYEVQPADPAIWLAVLTLMAIVSAIAVAGPSRRALRTAPADALREE